MIIELNISSHTIKGELFRDSFFRKGSSNHEKQKKIINEIRKLEERK